MQAICAALPEFQQVRFDNIAAPRFGHGHLIRIRIDLFEFGQASFERSPRRQFGALVGYDGAYAAAFRATPEVSL